jgi:hypothetical protein
LSIGFFKIGSQELFASGWLRTTILLVSAFWETRIIEVSHLSFRASCGHLCQDAPALPSWVAGTTGTHNHAQVTRLYSFLFTFVFLFLRYKR